MELPLRLGGMDAVPSDRDQASMSWSGFLIPTRGGSGKQGNQ